MDYVERLLHVRGDEFSLETWGLDFDRVRQRSGARLAARGSMIVLMPFGKYRGYELDELPSDYLAWLDGLDDLRDPLRSAIEAERERRAGHRRDDDFSQRPAFQFSKPERDTARRIVEAGRRSLAKAQHPDAGGSLVAMTKINVVADAMLEALL